MTWTAPKTWVSDEVLTADDLNVYLRDNLLELSPSKATTAGSIFVTESPSVISERIIMSDYIAASESSSATSYTDLRTVGPSVTVKTSSQAFVFLYCHMYATLSNSSTPDNYAVWMNFDVTGATTDFAVNRDSTAIMLQSSNGQRWGITILYTNMNPGWNTFTVKYRVSQPTSGSAPIGTWSNRRIAVLPL